MTNLIIDGSNASRSDIHLEIARRILTANPKALFVNHNKWLLMKSNNSQKSQNTYTSFTSYYQINDRYEMIQEPLKIVIIKPINGLANRIRFLISSLAFGRYLDRKCFLVWEISNGFDSTPFSDLFESSFLHKHDLTLIDSKDNQLINCGIKLEEKIPGIYNGLSVTDYNAKIDMETLKQEAIISITGSNYLPYVFSHYPEFQHLTSQINQLSMKILADLKPLPSILSSVSTTIQSNLSGLSTSPSTLRHSYGFHIRRGESYNFDRSKTEYFLDIARSILRNEPLAKIFLSTNDSSTLEFFKRECPSITHSLAKHENIDWESSYLNKPRADQSSKDALQDLWLLSQCKMIYGTCESSFSKLAAMWGQKPIQIVDAYNPYHLYNDYVPGYSLVTCCMDRVPNLLKNLHSWQKCNWINEIIIVDWSSKDSFRDKVTSVRDIEIHYYRVNNQSTWKLTWAFNLAVCLAKYDKIVKLDCDVQILPEFFQANNGFDGLNHKKFYTGNWQSSSSPYLNGQIVVNKLDFLKVNGYNENIITYGYDDTDLYHRLGLIGLTRLDFKESSPAGEKLIQHLDHTDYDRISHCITNTRIEVISSHSKPLSRDNKNDKNDSEKTVPNSKLKEVITNSITANKELAKTNVWNKKQSRHLYLITDHEINLV